MPRPQVNECESKKNKKKRKQRLTKLKRRIFGRPQKLIFPKLSSLPQVHRFCPLSKLELRLRTTLADETSKGKFFGTGGGIGSMPGEWQSVPPESQARCRPVFGTWKWTLDRVLLGGRSQDSTQTWSEVLKGILILCCLNSSSYLWVISWKGNCILI